MNGRLMNAFGDQLTHLYDGGRSDKIPRVVLGGMQLTSLENVGHGGGCEGMILEGRASR